MVDKAYSSAANRAWLRRHGIKAVIPVSGRRFHSASRPSIDISSKCGRGVTWCGARETALIFAPWVICCSRPADAGARSTHREQAAEHRTSRTRFAAVATMGDDPPDL